MKNKKIQLIAKNVIQDEIYALKKLKSSIGNSFNQIVKTILNCRNGKIIISGVGKSGIIGKKWAAMNSSIGIPSFFLDASNASHGDMGQITSNDIVILISLSGQSEELKNIIQYTSRNKNIKLIGITSKKKSILYKNSDIKFLLPSVKEADLGNIVPTSTTTIQLALGDAIAITCMRYNNFGKLDFKKFHPGGSLSVKLKTVNDLMFTGNKIPFVKENTTMKDALNTITSKGLGVLLIKKRNITTGILTDGDLKRLSQKYENFQKLTIKKVMKKNPVSVDKNTLAAQALSIMNAKKITSLCVHKENQKNKTIGIIHIHNILKANIS
ncbi:MAG: arabinose-5-phosphate isomerase [Parcubacteria group bacterium]|nr:arabinose-5-phosphate isomerase [Parcubacteria group bacterium]|tara:strand:- start:169 stop:1146 length:978 start_codon:yes stop_codon:yes gene_type:complete